MIKQRTIVDSLDKGLICCIPTDTQYGLVAKATDKKAVERLFEVKGRNGKSGTIIAASVEQLFQFGVSKHDVSRIVHLWPAAVSIALPCSRSFGYLHQSQDAPVFRIPDNESLRQLLEQTGPLMTTSANRPGEQPAGTVALAQEIFGDAVSIYIDGGDLSNRLPSTILALTPNGYKVIRRGAVQL